VSPAKSDDPIEVPFWMWTLGAHGAVLCVGRTTKGHFWGSYLACPDLSAVDIPNLICKGICDAVLATCTVATCFTFSINILSPKITVSYEESVYACVIFILSSYRMGARLVEHWYHDGVVSVGVAAT